MIIKTKAQLDILREGGAKLGYILRKLGEYVEGGTGKVSTLDIENRARKLIKESGGESASLNYSPAGAPRPYPAVTCVSVNDEVVHGIPNEDPKILKEGDVVSIDCLLKYKGLITDACITVGVGDVSDEDKRLIKSVKKALYTAIDIVKPGVTTKDIGCVIHDIARKTGFSVPPELGGHGVGESVHEDPFIPNVCNKDKGTVLREGMVLAIEPIFMAGESELKLLPDGYTYVSRDGKKSAQFEHTVVVTKNGAEILTASEEY